MGRRGKTVVVLSVGVVFTLATGCPPAPSPPATAPSSAAAASPAGAPASSPPAGGRAGPGTIRQNNVEVPIWGGVAVWDAKAPFLRVELLPFEPTQQIADSLRTNFAFSELMKLSSPDASKWASWCPWATLTIYDADTTPGQKTAKKPSLTLWSIEKEKQSISLNPTTGTVTWEGTLAEGSQIRLTGSGHDKIATSPGGEVTYDFTVSAKVVLAK